MPIHNVNLSTNQRGEVGLLDVDTGITHQFSSAAVRSFCATDRLLRDNRFPKAGDAVLPGGYVLFTTLFNRFQRVIR